MNFSGISNRTLVGRLLRLPLSLIPPEATMPILQSKSKGKRWIVGSSDHGCWLGSYEYAKRRAFENAVKEGSTVFDIGANAGFYTVLASALVGANGRVFAFEPVPSNLHYLREHLRLNAIKNVSVIEAAVSDRTGVAYFYEGPNASMGHIAAEGRLPVRTVALDEMVLRGEVPPPHCIKIDVEGAEALVLRGANLILFDYHPTIFLAAHGDEIRRECCQLLRSLQYELSPLAATSLDKADEIIAFR